MHNERKPLSLNTKIFESETVYYTVKSILGYGGTGITYKCISSSDGNYYCLKELYPTELADCLVRQSNGSIIFNTMFENEELLKTWIWYKENLINETKKQQVSSVDKKLEVNDPYFLKSYGTFTSDNGNLYARYDIQNGSALSPIINELSLSEIISVLITACKKLESLHNNKGLLHLDLSPANIYVIEHARGKEAYFLDFGNAKKINESDDNHRYSATEGYSAQEVLARTEGNNSSVYEVAPYSDTYSLVAILFKALTDEAYSAEHRIDPALWENKVHSKLEECGAKIAAESLINILRRGLSEQQKRYQSADQLINDLYDINKLITGNNSEIYSLVKDIEERITNFESEIKKTRKFSWIIAACFTAVVIIALAIINFCDFQAPRITLQGCSMSDNGAIEVFGDSLDCTLNITDDKGVGWHNITTSDIFFDGFTCELDELKNSNFNSYNIKLLNIQKTSDTAYIVIKAGCVKDINENTLGETRIPVVFKCKEGDNSPPTVNIGRPYPAQNNNLICNSSDITFDIYVADETQIKDVYLTQEHINKYIHAVNFNYDKMNIDETDGKYRVTFVNVEGDNGKHHIYISPGIAVDTNNNYSRGVQSHFFYLYNDENDIDMSAPAMTISTPTIVDSTVEYRIAVNDNIGIRSFALTERDITTIGFSADIKIEYVSISSSKDSVRIIRFTNIKSTSNSSEKYFIINSGVATDNFDNQTKAKISPSFSISE